MQIKPHKLRGVFEIKLERIADARGYFMRSYSRSIFAERGLVVDWEQESVSFNRVRNTVRGLHFQLPPYTETKVVQVTHGAVWDVFVDLRSGSDTYGKWGSLELSSENDTAIYIPKGFAHGFKTLTDDTIVAYKIDTAYHPELSSGVFWNDPDLAIDWNVEKPVISVRDVELQKFADFVSPF
jgi:dTDP-4-dehydrorhamnose 3,5-epimerase